MENSLKDVIGGFHLHLFEQLSIHDHLSCHLKYHPSLQANCSNVNELEFELSRMLMKPPLKTNNFWKVSHLIFDKNVSGAEIFMNPRFLIENISIKLRLDCKRGGNDDIRCFLTA